ncbi:uncharacterized protein LOC133549259 [Nerophis ophidion]|uniref:uncharacterized protein LOC133549259 n=1 Tax=Nerophis ophidion TaxID=159077 RepID=UPI002AE06A68|nr:uncharacterized protein LOC133549259 [Nerophis ophidion]XP_061750472.1 uncharacterized protein LOC133549259 [Nerophis ophidion]
MPSDLENRPCCPVEGLRKNVPQCQPAAHSGSILHSWTTSPVTGQRSPPTVKRHPVVHVSQIKPVCSSPLSSPDPIPPPPRILDNGDPVWTVKEILGVRRQGRGLVFLVDWEGYGPEDRSWVPASYLADPSLLKNFYQANPGALRRSSGASHKRGGTVMMHTPSASPSPAVAPRGPAVRTARHAPARAAQTAAMRLHSCRQSPINAAGLDERQRHKNSRH